MKSTKRKRKADSDYEDDSGFEDVAPHRLPSIRLLARRLSHAAVVDKVVPESGRERERPSGTWRPVKQRLRDAVGLLRALFFVNFDDERVCLRLRGFLQFKQRKVSWMAFHKSKTRLRSTMQAAIEDLRNVMPTSLKEDLNESELQTALSTILAQILRGDVTEYRPLVDKLTPGRLLKMERLLGTVYTDDLSRGGALRDLEGLRSWFVIRKREPEQLIDRSLEELQEFPQVHDWIVDEHDHTARQDAFERKATRALETTAVKARLKKLTTERKKTTWRPSEEQALDQEINDVKKEVAYLEAEKKLLLQRTRKYRLFPTKEQEKTLKRFMGTCRWTYNQAVAHFRATNEFSSVNLINHYVTNSSGKTLMYPEGMERPPEWAHDTPNSIRSNVMRTFQTNVTSAFSNLKKGNIKKFKILFSSKKRSPDFTFSENGRNAKIVQNGSSFYLSITKLKNIRVKMGTLVTIDSEIDIIYNNGFWYVAIPEVVKPEAYEYPKSCIALDPGIRAFMTGVDLQGNVLEFGRDTKTRLNAVQSRQAAAQSVMAKFKNQKGKSKWWHYRTYEKAKRTFLSCTAKLKNLVKDLHYKTCAYLTKLYDVILLPTFKTKDMVKKTVHATTDSTRAC